MSRRWWAGARPRRNDERRLAGPVRAERAGAPPGTRSAGTASAPHRPAKRLVRLRAERTPATTRSTACARRRADVVRAAGPESHAGVPRGTRHDARGPTVAHEDLEPVAPLPRLRAPSGAAREVPRE